MIALRHRTAHAAAVGCAARRADGHNSPNRVEREHPLIRVFAPDGATLANYLALDDVVMMEAFRRTCPAPDALIASLARRLRDRDLDKTLDLAGFGHDEGVQRREARRIDSRFADKLRDGQIIKDESTA